MSVRRKKGESGQAIILVILGFSIFLLAGVGLAIDGSHLYAQRQMAQGAADAAAQAGVMSIFEGTYGSGTHAFAIAAGTTYTCSSSDARVPCYYAQTMNGFNSTSDAVTYTPNPSGVSITGTSTTYPVNLLQVTVTRNVPATLMRLIGFTTVPVSATGIAAIVQVYSPIPIIVTNPVLCGSFDNGGTGSTSKIQILGGPPQSVQVNSSCTTAMTWTGNPVIDLSQAGPNGTGANFGTLGGPTNGGSIVSLGTTGQFIDGSPAIPDPFAGVTPPTDPSTWTTPGPTNSNNNSTTIPAGSHGCPTGGGSCNLYFPGRYDTKDLKVKNATAVFAPGIYYLYGVNFTGDSNGNMYAATGLTDSNTTTTPSVATCCGTGTGWGAAGNTPANAGILVYLTGPASGGTNPTDAAGTFSVSSNSNVSLVGSPNSSAYQGILFFVDRHAAAATDSLDGGGGLTLYGSIYTTSAYNTSSVYQTLHFQGNAGSSTILTGEIVTSKLELQGTPGIVMTLSDQAAYDVNQVALVQ